jgi:hypothetical protein
MSLLFVVKGVGAGCDLKNGLLPSLVGGDVGTAGEAPPLIKRLKGLFLFLSIEAALIGGTGGGGGTAGAI